jgi:hypothetical protein
VSGTSGAAGFAAKLLAFLRRDFLEALTYRFTFVSSLAGILVSSATFYFVAKLVPPGARSLEAYGGDYFSFAVVGIAFSSLLGIFQEGLPSVIRGAQVAGTLEALLVTRTSVPTRSSWARRCTRSSSRRSGRGFTSAWPRPFSGSRSAGSTDRAFSPSWPSRRSVS